MNHFDWCTHVKFKEDLDILTRKNFDVNMRLFNSNSSYKNIILQCCAHIEFATLEEKEGYKKPHGWSGANAGIPFNIISFFDEDQFVVTMINPKIIRYSGVSKMIKTNCGSLTLTKSIEEPRDPLISVEYYDISGNKHIWENIGPTPGYTIQHEINHTRGILLRYANTSNN